jgi:hypothetical protein
MKENNSESEKYYIMKEKQFGERSERKTIWRVRSERKQFGE